MCQSPFSPLCNAAAFRCQLLRSLGLYAVHKEARETIPTPCPLQGDSTCRSAYKETDSVQIAFFPLVSSFPALLLCHAKWPLRSEIMCSSSKILAVVSAD